METESVGVSGYFSPGHPQYSHLTTHYFYIGADCEIRTRHFLFTREALYQMS